jgi:hypothetical protein
VGLPATVSGWETAVKGGHGKKEGVIQSHSEAQVVGSSDSERSGWRPTLGRSKSHCLRVVAEPKHETCGWHSVQPPGLQVLAARGV